MCLYFLVLLISITIYSSTGCTELIGNSPSWIRRNNRLHVLPVWGPEYEIKFDIKFISWPSDTWFNIFRLSARDGNCCELGQRIPGLWTKQEGSTGILGLWPSTDANLHQFYSYQLGRFQKSKWYHFTFSQRKNKGDNDYFFDVKINGIKQFHRRVHDPRAFLNVGVYVSDNYHLPANAEIQNFYICPEPSKEGRIHQNDCPRSGKVVWVKLGENCFHVSRLKMNWGQAKRYCLGQGGYLAEIMSREEEELLDTYLVAGISYWLGLNDLKKQGVYTWDHSGQVAKYTNFPKGEPNAKDQNCVWKTYHPTRAGWHDAICSWDNYGNGYGEQHALCQISSA